MSRTAALELAILGVAVLELLLVALSLMDVVRKPEQAWTASGRARGTWVAALLGSTLLPFPLIAIPLFYLLRVRPSLARARG